MNKLNPDYTINSSRMDEWGASVPRIFSVPGKLSTRIKKDGVNEQNSSHHIISSSGKIIIPIVNYPQIWMTGYIQGNGTLDAVASGSLTNIDVTGSTWSRISIVEAPSSTSYMAGSTPGTDMIYTYWTTPTAVRGAIRISGSVYGTAVPTTAPTGTVRVIQVTYRDIEHQIACKIVASGGASTLNVQNTTSRAVFLSNAIIGSRDEFPYTGKIWADIIYLGEPIQADLEALLAGTPPWVVWDPTLVARAWCPAAAYSSGNPAIVKIPDLAQANGGVYVAVDAILRNGDMGDIVIV